MASLRNWTWVGLQNYADLLWREPHLRRRRCSAAALNTLWVMIAVPLLTIVVAFPLAVLLNSVRRFAGLLRSVYFLPYVTAGIAVYFAWQYVLQPNGAINMLLGLARPRLAAAAAGLPRQPVDTALPTLIVVMVWSAVPVAMMLYLAGLQTIDTVADRGGADRRRRLVAHQPQRRLAAAAADHGRGRAAQPARRAAGLPDLPDHDQRRARPTTPTCSASRPTGWRSCPSSRRRSAWPARSGWLLFVVALVVSPWSTCGSCGGSMTDIADDTATRPRNTGPRRRAARRTGRARRRPDRRRRAAGRLRGRSACTRSCGWCRRRSRTRSRSSPTAT